MDGQGHAVCFFTKEFVLAKRQPHFPKGGWGVTEDSKQPQDQMPLKFCASSVLTHNMDRT